MKGMNGLSFEREVFVARGMSLSVVKSLVVQRFLSTYNKVLLCSTLEVSPPFVKRPILLILKQSRLDMCTDVLTDRSCEGHALFLIRKRNVARGMSFLFHEEPVCAQLAFVHVAFMLRDVGKERYCGRPGWLIVRKRSACCKRHVPLCREEPACPKVFINLQQSVALFYAGGVASVYQTSYILILKQSRLDMCTVGLTDRSCEAHALFLIRKRDVAKGM